MLLIVLLYERNGEVRMGWVVGAGGTIVLSLPVLGVISWDAFWTILVGIGMIGGAIARL